MTSRVAVCLSDWPPGTLAHQDNMRPITYLLKDHGVCACANTGSTMYTVKQNLDGSMPDAHTGRVLYRAWGEIRHSSGGTPTDQRYTGQRDFGLGLYFYNARFYDSSLGRFISADTLIPNPGNVLDWDRYAAMRNNPLKYTDPTGHFCEMVGTNEICSADPDSNGHWGTVYDRRIDTDRDGWISMSEAEAYFLKQIRNPLRSNNPLYRNFGQSRDLDHPKGKRPGQRQYHMSIDAGYKAGDPVYPLSEGVVTHAGWSHDFGNFIMIEHDIFGYMFYSVYAHLGKSKEDTGIFTSTGQTVNANTKIGEVGTTKGDTGTSAHLHVEVRTANNVTVDAANPFRNHYFWGYTSDWRRYFLDLGQIFGYHNDYFTIPNH
jgi:RHS repeat-associated protein